MTDREALDRATFVIPLNSDLNMIFSQPSSFQINLSIFSPSGEKYNKRATSWPRAKLSASVKLLNLVGLLIAAQSPDHVLDS